ncbi:hypothetical protein [Halomonas sp. HAL1]|uniref:hypothetical protein n=1 Tax=Halomonas sp. HAL1 TaxID=550984 RepID=UPI00022D32CE|nr:hypothetical protein [Halomonas sp. HAL1]EHA16359.1 hypothetical protein HAL1_06750 [Halomonas sp. HAL1]WKV94204.1 hypothetical protein Q3Y66_06175 [Halomonas sp. HAL1]
MAKRETMVKALEETENALTKCGNARAACRENVKLYTDAFTQAKAAVERVDAPLRAAYEAERELRLRHAKERAQTLRESLEGKSTLKKRQLTKERELAELNETAPAAILQWLGKFIPMRSVERWKSEKASLRHDIKEVDSAVSYASEVIALTQASLNTANE